MLTEPDVFSLSPPSEASSSMAGQRPVLDAATYGLSSAEALSALGLEPHLLLLLLHKHRGSWRVQRVSALALTLLLCYILAGEIRELLQKHSAGVNFRF